ncbi:MAG: methyl-accepting chemotaxis protein, partial [Acidobacteriota bacterium]
GTALVRQSGDALRSIIDGSTAVLEGITQSAVASEQHAATSGRIRQNMGAITDVTAATVTRNDDIAAAAGELGRLLDDLRQRIARFTVH